MPPQTEQNPPKRHTNLFLLTILMILVGILAVGCFMYQSWTPIGPMPSGFFDYLEKNQENQNLTTVDEFTNQKTYRNEEYGFEFKYPKEMDGFRTVESVNMLEFHLNVERSQWTDAEWKMFVIEIMTPKAWESYLSNDEPRPAFIASTTDKVFAYWKGHDCPESYCHLYENSDKIFSTFKFISTSTSSVDITNWQTYRNEEYGFEFKYPSGWIRNDYGVGSYFTTQNEISALQIDFETKEKFQKDTVNDTCPANYTIKTELGIIYVIYCSAGSEVYEHAIELTGGKVLKFGYKDNFDIYWPENKKIELFIQIISTFKFISTSTSATTN